MALVNATSFVPKIWNKAIMRSYEKNLVAKNICNTNAEGEIKAMGDTVYFNSLADPTVNTYSGSSITYETLSSSQLTLSIDQAKYFAFKVTDVEKAQANVDMQSSQATRAGYMLRDDVDKFILGKVTGANKTYDNSGSYVSVTAANAISVIGEIALILQQQNVPREKQFIVIPPWLQLKLRLAGIKFNIKEGASATNGVEWTNELGLDCYVSNNVALASGSTTNYNVMAGSTDAIVFAQQILNTEAMRLEETFDTGVRGLLVYGGLVVRPNDLVCAKLTAGAETTI